MLATLPHLSPSSFPSLKRQKLETLQLNLGYRCNQTCLHCHVNAGPNRVEQMNIRTIDQILAFLQTSSVTTLDLTGGAPEMSPNFRYLVDRASALDIKIIDRCNLTILEHEGFEDLADYLAHKQISIIASLPCYLEENVDGQRGNGVFQTSIKALHRLNDLGYGLDNSGLELNLVYNPAGPSLPPAQCTLEQDYKTQLKARYGIVFNQLLTLTNMPIQRFGSQLLSKGHFDDYIQLLKDNYRPENLNQVMCRNLISLDWQGYIYDCDFNQMLGLPTAIGDKPKLHISQLNNSLLDRSPITVLDHCYGCTAGQGSSCSGALR